MSANKTEQPTPKKIQDARKKGQVAKSADLTASVSVLMVFVGLMLMFPYMGSRLREFMVSCFNPMLWTGPDRVMPVIDSGFKLFWELIGGVLVLAAIPAALLTFIQVGPLVRAPKPDMKNLNPLEGLKGMVKPDRFIELLKNALKITLAIVTGILVVRSHLESLAGTPDSNLVTILDFSFIATKQVGYSIGMAFILFGGVDLFYQRHKFKKQLMMTKDEVKREYKEMEGDPEIKSKRQQLQQELASMEMIRKVPEATCVIVNPTHLAVAVQYERGSNSAPRVTAKGTGSVALSIRRLANKHRIPIIENRPLAHDLIRVYLGDEIPEKLFDVVADILLAITDAPFES